MKAKGSLDFWSLKSIAIVVARPKPQLTETAHRIGLTNHMVKINRFVTIAMGH